jgi:hypothetical protein
MSGLLALKAPRTCVIADGRRKVHSVFTDDSEMVEEFDVITDELLLRKVRKASTALGGEAPWEIEIGAEHSLEAARSKRFNPDSDLLKESNTNPILSRQDTPQLHQWRIRNLPYPPETYNLSVEPDAIVVRTTNKKYFKKIEIPDMKRLNLPLDPAALSWVHQHNTLIISYKKHLAIQTAEAAAKKERASMEAVRLKDDKAGCAQQ